MATRMKVVLAVARVYPYHGYAGGMKYPYTLARDLAKQGVDVEIVTGHHHPSVKPVETGIKYVFISPPTHSKVVGAIWMNLYGLNLARYLRKKEFDILHSFIGVAYTYLHFKHRSPTVVQPFGLEPFTDLAFLERRGLKKVYTDVLHRYPNRYCIKHADAIASEGDFQTDQITKLFNIEEGKIFNLPVGIDVSFIKERLKARRISRVDLGLRKDDFIMISVNQFLLSKGLGYLVDAFAIIKQKLNKSRLIIIGNSGADENYIMNQIRDCQLTEDIVVLKDVPEDSLYDYYALSDLYVSPTLQSDIIMSIQEAMVCGLPVVSTGQEMLVKPGVNGYIVPKKDATAIAEAVLKIHDEGKCQEMGRMSRQLIGSYDSSQIASLAIAQYEKMLARKT